MMKTLYSCSLLFLVGLVGGSTLLAADWPQRRGPDQTGVSGETLDYGGWEESGPEVLWRASVGTGVSSMIVQDGVVYAFGNTGDRDKVAALDAKTGKEIWAFDYSCPLDSRMFSGGTATSPTYDDGMVYTLSHEGELHALEAKTGKKVWHRNLVKDFKGKRPRWGYAQSPVVVDNLLVTVPGGKGSGVVALDKKTGEKVWATGSEEAGYGTPFAFESGGKKILGVFNAFGLVGVEAASGKELFRHRWETKWDVNATTPIVHDDLIFVSSGYGTGSGVFQPTDGGVNEKWTSKEFQNQMTNSVLHDGVLYGFSMKHVNNPGNRSLRAVDLKTGEVLWKTNDPNMGGLIVVGGKLVIQSVGGEVIVAEPNRDAFKELARYQVLGGTSWVTPAYADGVLYLRNNTGKVAAVKGS